MLLQQLRYLDALAREQHFGRAAEALHVSQPALSTGLARLERELGLALVQRGRQFEGLTREGEALLTWAREAIGSVDGLAAEAAQLRGGLAGTLRVGVIPTANAQVGTVLGPFMHAHPGVRITISTGPSGELLAALSTRDLDAALVYTGVDAIPAGFDVRPLYEEHFLLLTSDRRWRAGHGPVTWKEAAALPLCLLATSMTNRQLIDGAFAAAGATPHVHAEADSIASLIDLGSAGSTCIVASAWLEGRKLPRGAHVHPLVGPELAPTIGAVTRRGPVESPVVRELRALLPRPDSSGPAAS